MHRRHAAVRRRSKTNTFLPPPPPRSEFKVAGEKRERRWGEGKEEKKIREGMGREKRGSVGESAGLRSLISRLNAYRNKGIRSASTRRRTGRGKTKEQRTGGREGGKGEKERKTKRVRKRGREYNERETGTKTCVLKVRSPSRCAWIPL